MNNNVVANASISAAGIEYHTPSSLRNMGRIRTRTSWYTSVLRKDIAADAGPLLSAVKNDEAKMQNPENRKEIEKIFSPRTVISRSAVS